MFCVRANSRNRRIYEAFNDVQDQGLAKKAARDASPTSPRKLPTSGMTTAPRLMFRLRNDVRVDAHIVAFLPSRAARTMVRMCDRSLTEGMFWARTVAPTNVASPIDQPRSNDSLKCN